MKVKDLLNALWPFDPQDDVVLATGEDGEAGDIYNIKFVEANKHTGEAELWFDTNRKAKEG